MAFVRLLIYYYLPVFYLLILLTYAKRPKNATK